MWKKLVTVEQMRAMSDDQLTAEINGFAVPPVSTLTNVDSGDVGAAQFYMSELNRRLDERAQEQRDEIESKRWRIDQRNEYIIIAMIGVEIILAIGLAIWGDWRQSQDIGKQLAEFRQVEENLKALQESSLATARALQDMKDTSEAMNHAIQGQLNLNYIMSVEIQYETNYGALKVANNGRSTITFWGVKVEGEKAEFLRVYKSIAPSGSTITSAIEDLATKMQGGLGSKMYEVFLKNENNVEFIARCQVSVMPTTEHIPFRVVVSPTDVRQERWPRNK